MEFSYKAEQKEKYFYPRRSPNRRFSSFLHCLVHILRSADSSVATVIYPRRSSSHSNREEGEEKQVRRDKGIGRREERREERNNKDKDKRWHQRGGGSGR